MAETTGTRVTRRALLGGALAALAGSALAEGPVDSLRPRARPSNLGKSTAPSAESLVEKARLTGRVGYVVADAESGLTLEGQDTRVALPPASVCKALTSVYALEVLGADHRFETTLLATGPILDGRLDGDLVLFGSGDPTLDTDGLGTLATRLKEAGVTEVAGRFLVYGGALPFVPTIDVEQPDHVAYSPAVSGLNLNFNRVHFEWKRESGKWDVTMDARTGKYRPDVTVASMQVADRAGPVYTYEDRDDRDRWTVADGALGKGGSRWLPIFKPELYAGEVFGILARAHGIVLKEAELAELPPEGEVLASFESGPLVEILEDMLYHSTNITAECVGMSASRKLNPGTASLVESAATMSGWLSDKFRTDGVAVVDHSGLGGDSRVMADAMMRVLADPISQKRLRPILKSITMRDKQRRPLPNSPTKVVAKTGTLNFVSGLAGYITGPGGKELVFAIFCADVPRREALGDHERERPPGMMAWNGRAKILQQDLIDRWSETYR
ncbi:D-alanyl-D-alanine carboxypeptidase [Pseudooceanicola nanhaiensis]|jgi:D-alanyl-D-alanine carboxypeptidase/D-alanyl-D-alanine-endopeptidase (penicillin-binding protein 4)|uniref:D-alanyl-D-alanine carboxypeptidase n=1 Tax=Pseudooceanicola nanhaiensis TaxID=375761 RepID=A0A917WEU0_9RHOB|nr:D-alanyl-D-alanine carboxypeptidase/D-alanyl-D-alanine-endopeptidase [Pseudooceanicola nanhaiensis]GGL98096.1 D-alanyl-D-alanine carboxypeptidase [Pseudooceanicola nanhaiensis]